MLFKGTDIYGTLDFEKEKLLLDKIEELYEEYRSIDMSDVKNRDMSMVPNRFYLWRSAK